MIVINPIFALVTSCLWRVWRSCYPICRKDFFLGYPAPDMNLVFIFLYFLLTLLILIGSACLWDSFVWRSCITNLLAGKRVTNRTTEITHEITFWRDAAVPNKCYEFSAITGGSCHKNHFCRDKNTSFVATKVLSRLTFCCDKAFVAINIILSRQAYFCRDKHVFVVTDICRDKSFVAASLLVSRQTCVFVSTKLILVAAPANDTVLPRTYFNTMMQSWFVCPDGAGKMGGFSFFLKLCPIERREKGSHSEKKGKSLFCRKRSSITADDGV